jgi:multiple sugar transport system substrate-binding protein
MFKKISLLFVTVALGSFILIGCGPSASKANAPAAPGKTSVQILDQKDFQTAKIDWRSIAKKAPEEGVSLHVAMVKHPFTDSLLPLIPEFESLTGIKVLYDILPQDEYWPKIAIDLSSGAGFTDVFMTGPELDWAFIRPGWLEPLDKYIGNKDLTDSAWYNQPDFYPAAWDANRWDGKTLGHGGYGKGPVYAVPVTYEIMSLVYRKDLLEKAGIKADASWPKTWQDILDAAKLMTLDKNGKHYGEAGFDPKNVVQYGYIGRGSKTWASMFGGYSNIFYSYGASDFDENLKPTVNSERGVQATQLWSDLMSHTAPAGSTDLQWFQVKQAFASGTAAMSIDCDWFAAATYEKPEVSKVAGKLGYALTPPGPDGLRVEDLWFWSLGMNSHSYHKDAAWLFIQWATSRQVMLHSTTDFENWNPPRQSVWNDPKVVAMSSKWANYRQVVEENHKYSKVPHAVNTQVAAVGDAWWGNIQDAILGKVTAKQALDLAAKDMYNLMDKAGAYKK